MTQPVSFGSRASLDSLQAERDTCQQAQRSDCAESFGEAHSDDPPLRYDPASPALLFCRDAKTVTSGFLCGEPSVVSTACRKPSNAFDAYVCDEPRMRQLQESIVSQTLSLLKALLLNWAGTLRK